jgi:simple sugar transport system ATP-binding protein
MDNHDVEVLRVEHIAKRFGALTALRDVSLRLGEGEVLGLIGDNGAGKSTLIKILCGFHQPDAGTIAVRGEQVVLRSVDHARSIGIDTVYQDLALSGGQRQAIAVARSVYSDAKILLLDEPLAAMGAKEGALILDLVRDLKSRGDVSIVIIAHNYAQVLEVCDRVNVLQHGEITFDKPTADTSIAELTELVVAEYRAARAERKR